jgi:phage shock protein PspC (stress-responsive transcriptional regulator)
MINLKDKRLYRSPKEGILLGIAAGVGHYLEVDPVFVRLVWVGVAALTHIWPAVLLYGALFFVVPVDPAQETVPQSQTPKDVTSKSPEEQQSSEPVEKMDSAQNM